MPAKLARNFGDESNRICRKSGQEEVPGHHFATRPLETEGTSQDEALERLYELAKKRLASAQLFQMNLPGASTANPWQAFAGIWKDHPEFDAFLENIAEYRRSESRTDSSS